MNKRIISLLLTAAMMVGMFAGISLTKVSAADDSLMLWYRFNEGTGTTVADSSGKAEYSGTLNGTCSWTTAPNGSGAVEFGGEATESAYVKMPDKILAEVTDITVSTSVYVAPANEDPAWICTFGSALNAADGTKYFGLLEDRDGNFRSTISTDWWEGEKNTDKGASLGKGVWKHVAFTLSGDTGTLYEDGVQIAQETGITIDPEDIEETIGNYIGKPEYSDDKYFKGKISDFRIYNRALSSSEIENLWIESLSDADAVTEVEGLLDLGDISEVKADISLPAAYADISISWSSDNTNVIANDGTVTRPADADTTVTLTAAISRGSETTTKTFDATVLKSGTVYSLDSTAYTLKKNTTHATILTATYEDLTTEDVTSSTAFTSSDSAVAAIDDAGVVTGVSEGNATITATYNGIEYTAEVTVVNDMVVWYKLDETSGTTAVDSSGNAIAKNGTLYGGATWLDGDGVELDGTDGYVDIPDGILAGVMDITASARVFVDPSNGYNSWLFNFGTTIDSAGDANAHYFGLVLQSSAYRAVLSTTQWNNEQNTLVNSAFSQGVWKYVTYTQTGTIGTLYVDGVQVAQNTNVAYTPKDMETTVANFIGRAPYTGDKYFKGKVSDFRVYNRALSVSEIEDIINVSADKTALDLGVLSSLTADITLPTTGANGSTITWETSDAAIGTDGTVTCPGVGEEDKTVTLTATIIKGNIQDTKEFTATVLAASTISPTGVTLDQSDVSMDKEDTIQLTATVLPSNATNKAVTWSSSDDSIATVSGEVYDSETGTTSATVTAVAAGTATITATTESGSETANCSITVNTDTESGMVLWYKLDETSGTTAIDSSGNGNNGTLNGGASWLNGDGVELDGTDGYVDIPDGSDGILAGVTDTTVSARVFVDPSNKYNSWIFNFSSTTNSANDDNAHYFGLVLESSVYRAVLSTTKWNNEQNTKVNSGLDTGVWKHIAYTQTGSTGTLYVDGVQVAQNTNVAYAPKDMEKTVENFIGRAPYTADNYFKGKISDFRLYDRALSAADVQALSDNGSPEVVALDKADLDLGDLSQVTSKITLPTEGTNGSTISWTSSDENLVSSAGYVTRPQYSEGDKQATLTATITKGSASDTKTFDVTVIAMAEGEDQAIEVAKLDLVIPNADDIRGNITLPETIDVDIDADGETVNITWETDRTDIINVNEVVNADYDNTPAGVVTRPDTDTQVTLTATLTHGTATETKDITITVKAKPETIEESDYKAYMFTYFTGNSGNQEQIYFASSTDGLYWDELNDNEPVLTSSVGDKGVRDPFILRSPEGDKFYMIATDLRIANGAGWGAAQTAGSQSIVVWESNDLVNWSTERLVKVARDDAGCTWAPEIVYDDKTGEYLVYWASRIAEDNYAKQRIYIAKTRDFYTFTDPEVYLERDDDVIDSTMIEYDGVYYRFSKDETNKNIILDKSDQLLGKEFEIISAPVVGEQEGVEGPAIFKFNGENKWCLLLDNYGGGGYYPLVSTDLASGDFRVLESSEYDLPSGPRHGTVMQITQDEYDAIQAKWSVVVETPDEEEQEDPILEYDFEETSTDNTIQDVSGNAYTGSLNGNAVYVTDEEKDSQVLYLDGTDGTFAAFPEGFFDGRDTVSISMDIKPETVSGNFFTFTIGKSDTKYMFLRTRDTQIRNAITVNSYSSEQAAAATTDSIQSKWMNIKLVITPTSMAIYKDGELIAENNDVTISMTDLGADLLAYLGKSFYSGDDYFKGYFNNVKVYNRALSQLEIANEYGVEISPIKDVTAEGYHIIKTDLDVDNKKAQIYFSVNNSTKKDLTAVPLTYDLVEDCTIEGENGASVDLTSPITVTINMPEEEQQIWTVEGVLCNNPILGGQYADPDIDVFGDTYYIYPTTDGFSGWSGTEFHVFSSTDMIDWNDEGVILDVATDDVPWAVGSAWAPTIEEKNGTYYFYFCAKNSDGDSCIGVATSESPTGPFTAQEEPLITPEIASTEGISMGQTIDPSIFTDDDETSYMLFGNGNAAVVELNDDMISFKSGTMKNISGAEDLREAITVIKRNGTYHFTWSCDDTGSANYHVNYGTSDNIYGPITFQYTILSKDTSQDILGTGHHSILKIPEKDEYYIAYHRFYTPLGEYTSGLGYHRETCLDKMEFNENGYIEVITPTLEGITEPVTVAQAITLNPISDKKPGDTVTISGTTLLGEISIKVIDPDSTVLYFSVVSDTDFSDTFDLPTDAAAGTYTVVAGQDTTVATTTFNVSEEQTTVSVTGVTLDKSTLSLKVGRSGQLTATVAPSDAANKNITFSSDNDKITVGSAVYDISTGTTSVTIVGETVGTSIITATTEDGGYTAVCTVTVTRKSSSDNDDNDSSNSNNSNNNNDSSTTTTSPISSIDHGTVNIKPVADTASNRATVEITDDVLTKAAETAEADANGVKTIVINIKKVEGAEGNVVALSKGMLDKISVTQQIKVVTDTGTLQIPDTMLSNIKATADAVVQIEIANVDKASLSEDIKAEIGDRTVVDLNLKVNGSMLAWSNESAPVTVEIPYTPTAEELADPEHITVWYINGNGKTSAVPTGKYDTNTGKVTFKTTHFSKYAVAYVKKTFNDIENYDWAKKQIEVMASKGVINGTSDVTFDPSADIKRADFILLLVKALGLSAEANDNFADVSSNAYYADALAIAKELGIAAGVGDNKFNPEENISRQDMMTLIDRAMKIANKELEAGTDADLSKYADKSSIASYAAQSVSTLIKNGIVTGDGSNVNPLGNATRAETAVLIYRIYNK